MRNVVIVLAVLAVAAWSIPALAVDSAKSDGPAIGGFGGGGNMRSNDCPGAIIWDTGATDNWTPPAGCSTSASAGCFVNAENPGFPTDGRRLADDFIGDGQSVGYIKIWGRFNQQGYDYYISNPSSLHGFCVKFYQPRPDQQPIWCPDGTMPGETAIGDIVYDEYVTNFIPYELPTPALPRSFNYCMTLPIGFPTQAGQAYWVSVSADFDFTADGTQWFWRMYQGQWEPFCEASWWDTWGGVEVPWNAVSVAINMPCWTGYNASFVLYAGTPPPTGACCDPDGNCTVTTQDQCLPPDNWMSGYTCDPNPCPANPVENKSWGQIKNDYH